MKSPTKSIVKFWKRSSKILLFLARLAKEVFERGEFVNIITSDLVTQEEQFAFVNRLRRIDGEEFVFMSDPQNTVHLVTHFVGRLYELEKNPKVEKRVGSV